jgi:hypothetical protein
MDAILILAIGLGALVLKKSAAPTLSTVNTTKPLLLPAEGLTNMVAPALDTARMDYRSAALADARATGEAMRQAGAAAYNAVIASGGAHEEAMQAFTAAQNAVWVNPIYGPNIYPTGETQ